MKENKQKIIVYDAIMGSGKTHDAIERMRNYLEIGQKFIYITPFLSEIDRVKNSFKNNEVFTPLNMDEKGSGKYIVESNLIDENENIDLNAKKSYKYLNKSAQFLKMASQGKSIISTHSLFISLKKEDLSSFHDYILILDEVVTPLKIIKVGAKDIGILKNQELVLINQETNEVKFIDDDYNDAAFRGVKTLCKNNTVFYLDKYFFAWVFPVEIFKEFKEIQILTYLFEGSLLSAYFKIYSFQYDMIRKDSHEELLRFKQLLNIYGGSPNKVIGLNSYSKTWIYNLSKNDARKITDATSNIFKRIFKTKSHENGYTTFKDFNKKLAGKGYTKGFIPINARASNEFKDIKSMAYLGNRYYDPQINSFFRERGVELNEDLWALSELIQWIWRGCIREKKEMNLYIPSLRMRRLLCDWLDGKYIISNDLKITA